MLPSRPLQCLLLRIPLTRQCMQTPILLWTVVLPLVTIDYLSGTSFLLIRTTQRMFPLGLCQYIEDQYVFSLGPRCFSLAPYPPDAPTPVPLLLFVS